MSLDPIKTTQSIKEGYLNYLSTTFHLKDSELQEQFEEELKTPGKFVKGPILEATPPFETGKSVEELIQEEVLSPQFRKLNSDQLPLQRVLYQHQEKAIRKTVLKERNIVVATGTGSGKTEVFLMPILNHLFRQKEKGELSPGVRALLVYPMNALANDQMKRMRKLLKNYPHITFGRYTGETEEKQKAAEDRHRKMFGDELIQNELISREQMRNNPPHILLTNYAMLEYLLLRPDDHAFFDGEYAKDWRFLVIDEAHTYTGAKGIEMAMLIRRLKDRVVESEHGRLQCIATSATLGRGEEDFPDVAVFAQKLFGETVEWVEEDDTRQDVIKAFRKPMSELGESWGKPNSSLYEEFRKILNSESPMDDVIPSLLKKGKEKEVPEEILLRAESKVAKEDFERFLYELLKGDQRVIELRNLLEKEPQYLREAAKRVFGNSSDSNRQLVALVDLAARAKESEDDQPLIPARYHLFVRAIEGAYMSLRPKKQLYLERREQRDYSDKEYRVFEIAACRQCGATYLVGETEEVDGKFFLRQPGKHYFEHPGKLEFYLLLEDETVFSPTDEDEVVSYGDEVEDTPDTEKRYQLCAACSAIDRYNLFGPLCDCNSSNYCNLLKVSSKEGNVHLCPACGKQSPTGLVWRFLTGKDATASVLTTSLYQQIPPRKKQTTDGREQDTPDENEWYPIDHSDFSPSIEKESKEGRQLLIFSDSRQDAAFFAPYLNRTYSRILRRRLILKTIEDHKRSVFDNRWRVQDLVNPLQRAAEELELFSGMSLQEQKNEVWKWVLYELLAFDKRNSLEGLGCLGFSLVKPKGWRAPIPLMKPPWNLTEDEVWILFQILLDSFRTKGALLFPDNVSPKDEFFYPRNREYYFRENQSSRKKHIFSWSSAKSKAMNTRLDFLMRLVQQGLKVDLGEQECREVLTKIWQRCLFPNNRLSCWQEYFSSLPLPEEGTVYRMKYNFLSLRPGTIDEQIKWYYCDGCNNLTLYNLRGVCPTYQCEGKLRECRPEDVFADNHYRNLYLKIDPIQMKAEEHTAQLTSEAAAELQTDFLEGEVNVLSCSTTFELGVDVGELESVLLRNVPPSSANYVQRAGRAGRRTDSTAFALTFAQRRSHDLTHFSDPKRMVSGEIRAPHFELENEKIVRRHIYATALAEFWKQHPEMFRDVNSFFFTDGESGPSLFEKYLNKKDEHLKEALKRIVPENLHTVLEIDEYGWVNGLFDNDEGVLLKGTKEVEGDIDELEKAKEQILQKAKKSERAASDYYRAAAIDRTINTIKNRYLINFLSRRNVIPKYGFPVDVVKLQILHHTDEAKRLELDRDLRIALSEYAPSSQVVAGGKLWTSRYLKKRTDKEWPKYRYAVCDYCQHYQSIIADSQKKLDFCEACGSPLEGRNQGTFLIPEFGFIADKNVAKPSDEQPEKTYTTRTYYSGKAKEDKSIKLNTKGIRLIATPASYGRLAVVNHAGYQGFNVCTMCGYAILGNESTPSSHKTPWGTECSGTLKRNFLGHEFETDVLKLYFEGHTDNRKGFWFSLLYALLEGASSAEDIDRQDLDGCLYPVAGDPTKPALILFDDVPGGAGHVKRVAKSEDSLIRVLRASLKKLENCECGGEQGKTSCYGCLRNYRNQFCHDELNRGMIIRFLKKFVWELEE